MHLIDDLIFFDAPQIPDAAGGSTNFGGGAGQNCNVPRDQSYVNGAARIVAP